MKPIQFKKNDPEAKMPTRGTNGAAGYDLYALRDTELEPFSATLVPTGLEVAIPEGTALLVMNRSGQALKEELIVSNGVGLVDEDYRGHLQVLLTWFPHPIDVIESDFDDSGDMIGVSKNYRTRKVIKKGTRIGQAMLIPYFGQDWTEVDELPPTERGKNGFGSTGKE